MEHDEFFNDAANKEKRTAKISSAISEKIRLKYKAFQKVELSRLKTRHEDTKKLKELEEKLANLQDKMAFQGTLTLTRENGRLWPVYYFD